jgi:tetratricopeptide (TPR) repeat protein
LGKSYYQTDDFERGLDCFNELINIDDKVGMWYLYRGIYFYQKGNFDDAISQLVYAQSLDETIQEVHLFLGRSYEAQGETEKALKEFSIYREGMRSDIDAGENEMKILQPDK